jgi:hypothetical protein
MITIVLYAAALFIVGAVALTLIGFVLALRTQPKAGARDSRRPGTTSGVVATPPRGRHRDR